MKKDFGKRLLSLMLSVLMVIGIMPMSVFAAKENAFVLVVEAGGKLVVAPEYVYYTEGQTVRQALIESGHDFYGIERDWIAAIDGVTGNYIRSDEDGNFELDSPASEVEFYRFSESENDERHPNEGLKLLMTAMADYALKSADVKAAAKEEYDTAYASFVGIDSASAAVLADNINAAVKAYEDSQSGGAFAVTFTDGVNVHAGATITAENAYGKIWSDEDGDGVLSLPTGEYYFVLEKNGLRAEGNISVSGKMKIAAVLQEELWLDLDAFRLSGSYEAQNIEDGQFVDDEYALDEWNGRSLTVAVNDIFTGTVYSYVEYNEKVLSELPTLTAIYKAAQSGEEREQNIPFESYTSGVVGVLKKGAEGNIVVYRVSRTEEDGFTYSQDYTVIFERVPTLKSISVKDQDGVDQVATVKFDGNINEYTYKVVNDVTSVKINAIPYYESYSVAVNGTEVTGEVTLEVSTEKETKIEVAVTANGYTNTYVITILPGEGKKFNFITENQAVTLEVVNGNGEVMPYKKFREGASGNRYQYVLVPGETYSYVATENTYYHVADEFKIEDVANSTINVSVPTEDWLTALALGMSDSAKSKGNLPMESDFVKSNHRYEVELVDTEHLAYIWVTGISGTKINAIYDQVSNIQLYHGVNKKINLTSGYTKGAKLNRFLMDENPIENTLTVRLSKEVNGVTQYQDYFVDFTRSLTLKDISAKCDLATISLVQEDKTVGFDPNVKEYSVKVSMAADILEISTSRYTDKKAFGEEDVGYSVIVNGKEVEADGKAEIELDGTIETQFVTVIVENSKAPEGTTEYKINVLKSPPVETEFIVSPEKALLAVYEVMSGERVWPEENGKYQFCEGYSYNYVLTEYDYIGKAGTLEVTRNENEALVIRDGNEEHLVAESENGGAVTIEWSLEKAEENIEIDETIESEWKNFRGNDENNAITNAPIPRFAEEGTLYWANKLGKGIDSDAVGSPIIVEGDIITYAGDKIYRIDTVTGNVKATGNMDHKSAFSITPPTYAEGMVFVALSDGTVQAFNAKTLESLWLYKDPLGGQPNCPITVKNGYLYTGFWNSETGDANFICLTITDEDPIKEKESKNASWYHTALGGYYWAGAFVSNDYVMVGTDDGTNDCDSPTAKFLLFDAKTGYEYDCWNELNGDIRSTVSYDEETDAFYFTSKGGTFYSVKVVPAENGWQFDSKWSIDLDNGSETAPPMSTCSPAVYNGRAYIGVSGISQFGAYSGHNITVIDLDKKSIAYSVETQGYPQTSGLLTTAYEEESGYVYVYYFDNYTPGKLRLLRDKKGQTKADYLTTEKIDSGIHSVAYALFTPTGDHAQYAICSPIVDEYGTIYFKNDSAYLMAFGSMIEKIEVTQNPDKMTYAEGEFFNPEGMVVIATYANGKTRDVTDYITFNEDAFSETNKIVTISFKHVLYHNEEDGTSMISGVRTTTPVTTLEIEIGEGGDNGENPENPKDPEPPKEDVCYGDVDGNRKINVLDANLVRRCSAKLISFTEEQLLAADVDGNGKVNVLDANLIRRYTAKLISVFPIENN
ncbi:MAG: cadherin-like beta sandwich domain-containing protein [Clostridia bacterium]|nr:cadherin-like beta sandwich domain-containing protein [Clostridia bacterium]